MRLIAFMALFCALIVPAEAHRGHHRSTSLGTGCLKPQTRAMIAQLTRRIGPIVITSTCGGRHVRGSMHYVGKAIDFRPVNVSTARALAVLRSMPMVGGIGTYPSHIHADVGARKFAWSGGRSRIASRHRHHSRYAQAHRLRYASYRARYGYW